MGEHSDTDGIILRNVDAKRRISPAFLASCLKCTRNEAKKILESAAQRGIVRPLPNGWYELVPEPEGHLRIIKVFDPRNNL